MSIVITTADLNTYANKTLMAALAAQVVASVNDYIEGETKRCWGETKTITNELHNFGENLWLYQMDIQSIQSITMGWPGFQQSVLPSNGYFFNPNGRVTLMWTLYFNTLSVVSASKLYNDYISVAYTYGVTNVPSDLKEAALAIALQFYNWASSGGYAIVSSSLGAYRMETAGAIRSAGNTPPQPWKDAQEAHFMTIRRYAKPRV